MRIIDDMKENDCNGVIVRARKSQYFSRRRSRHIQIVEKISFSVLKRMSCKGCEKCGFVYEVLENELEENPLQYDYKTLEDEGVYEIVVVSDGAYTEYTEPDYWLELRKVKEV